MVETVAVAVLMGAGTAYASRMCPSRRPCRSVYDCLTPSAHPPLPCLRILILILILTLVLAEGQARAKGKAARMPMAMAMPTHACCITPMPRPGAAEPAAPGTA